MKRISSHYNIFASILFAVLVCCNSLPVIFGESSGIVAGTVIILWGLLFFLGIITSQRPNSTAVAIAFLLTLAHLISFSVHPSEVGSRYMTNFLIYGVLFLIIPVGVVDLKQVIKYIFYFGIILFPFYAIYDYGYGREASGDFDGGVLMTMSYRMLLFILASFLMLFDKTNKKWERLLALSIAVLYILVLLIVGARGAIISLLAFFSIYYIISGRNQKKKLSRLFLVVTVASLFYISFDYIIDYLFNLLFSNDLSARSIERMYYAELGDEDISAGRYGIYSKAIKEFMQSPLWGNGIGSFDSYRGTLPHNVFLQLLVEGGLFFAIPFLIIFLRGLVYIFKRGVFLPSSRFLLFLLCAGLFRLFFSYYLWGSHFIWLFILLVLNINYFKKYEQNSINNNSHL